MSVFVRRSKYASKVTKLVPWKKARPPVSSEMRLSALCPKLTARLLKLVSPSVGA